LIGLVCIDVETEFYAQRASQDQEIIESWTRYILDYFSVLQSIRRSIEQAAPLQHDCEQRLQDLKRDTDNSKAIYERFPARRHQLLIFSNNLKALEESSSQTSKLLDLFTSSLDQLFSTVKQGNLRLEQREARKESLSLLVQRLAGLAYLVEYDNQIASDPEKQSRIRKSWLLLLLACSILDLVLVLAIGIFFIGDIFKRLNTILTNVERIKLEEVLEPGVGGKDEISKLDESFHELSGIMNQTIYPYKTMLENARDLICSIDQHGRIIDVCRASVSLLGYNLNELRGTWINDIVEANDQSSFSAKLRSVVSGERESPFEVRMVCQDNSIIEVLWSLTWEKQDKNIIGIGHDVTAVKAAERFQQDVIQMVSHDLKSPLTAISNFHELLEAGVYGRLSDKYLQQVGVAKRSAERMLLLVNDLLAVERIRSGAFQLELREVGLAKVFEQAIESIVGLADSRHVTIKTVQTTDYAVLDERRIVQVIINLLSNAIKFSPENSQILLSAKTQERSVEVSVSDQGRGIPEHLISSIFNRFTQVRASDASKEGGSGLGLAICRALVEQHGGSISVINNFGSGCTFSFRIPQHGPLKKDDSSR
jgi:PAS domain S-box-containing protein